MKFLKKRKNKSIELFEGIKDLWLYNWEKMQEPLNEGQSINDRYKWLIKHDRDRDKNVPLYKLDKAYLKIRDEYALISGSIETITKWRTLTLKKMEAVAKLAAGDKFQQNFINAYQSQIDQIFGNSEGMSIVKERMQIKIHAKVDIDPKTTTLEEYIILKKEITKKGPTNE